MPAGTAGTRSRIDTDTNGNNQPSTSRTLLITVGSTLFPSLTNVILTPSILSLIAVSGIGKLIVQYGRAELVIPASLGIVMNAAGSGQGKWTMDSGALGGLGRSGLEKEIVFEVAVLRFTDDFETLMGSADYVISHAGSGSILSALRRTSPPALMVVPNTSLMDDHQSELADEMGKRGYLMVSTVENLESTLPRWFSQEWKTTITPFPAKNEERFRNILDDMMGFA